MNTPEDNISDSATQDLHYEAVMERAKKEQLIYLFVEGDSEEKSFDNFLYRSGLDIEKESVLIANYKTNGNLIHILNLFINTLSSKRPAIITYDNDSKTTQRTINDLKRTYKDYPNIIFFPIPFQPKVQNSDSYKGGSFEEMFDCDDFVNSCFSPEFLEEDWDKHKAIFIKSFNNNKTWFKQIEDYFYYNHQKIDKVQLAVYLSENITVIPETIIKLKELILEIRKDNTFSDPNDVELPTIPGLTI